MENFEELKTLVDTDKKINDFIKELGFRWESDNYRMQIAVDKPRVSTYQDLAKILGHDKLNELLKTFQSLVTAELYKHAEKSKKELARYSINVAGGRKSRCHPDEYGEPIHHD